MRAADGMPDRGDELSEEQRIALLGRIYKRHATPSNFVLHKVHSHREAWGWNSIDLEWEATLYVGSAKVHLLRLPDHVSMAEIAARYDAFGFSRREHRQAVFYSADLDPGSEWLRTTDVAMRNSALIEGQHLLLASADVELLERVVDTALGAAPAAGDSDAVVDAAGAAGRLIAASALVGEHACSATLPSWLWPEDREWLESSFPDLHRYDALIVGHRYDGEEAVGVIALGYARAAHAESDRQSRLLLAEGPTWDELMGWHDMGMETYYQQVDARVEDRTLLFEVVPSGNRPEMLFNMLAAGDMLFTICGENAPPQVGRR